MSHNLVNATSTALLLAAALTGACADAGDPDTIVLDGTSLAGYAWSGPYGDCCDENRMANVGWQIWFTNTDYCPASTAEFIAALAITTPQLVYPPSTELPQLATMSLPIMTPIGGPTEPPVTAPFAQLGVKDVDYAMGTLDLTTFTADEVAGTFTASGTLRELDQDPRKAELHGTFEAHRCSRIHD